MSEEEQVVEEPVEETQEESVEETPETEEVTEETTEDDKPEEEVAEKKEEPLPEKITIKVDGVDREYTREQILQLASKAQNADDRYQQAADGRKKVVDMIEGAKDNTAEFLESIGINVEDFATKYLTPIIEREQMTDEERRVYDIEQENKQLKSKDEKSVKEQEKAEQARLADQYRAGYDKEITEALTEVKLPKKPIIVSRVASYLISDRQMREDARKNGTLDRLGPEMSSKEAVALVKEDYNNEAKDILSSMDVQKIKEAIGEENFKKLKQADLDKITSPQDGNKLKSPTDPAGKRKSKKISQKEFDDYIEKISQGG